jgi:hypothetical protein
MKTHELKITADHFTDVSTGKKRAELRYNDRAFAAGDMLILKEWDTIISSYTGRSLAAKVTHFYAAPYLAEGYVMLSIRLLK